MEEEGGKKNKYSLLMYFNVLRKQLQALPMLCNHVIPETYIEMIIKI